ncbi:MAG: glycosyltransferase [Opitutales bacterium]
MIAPDTPPSAAENLLFFAPIASWPATHGGSLRTARLFEELCRQGRKGVLIGTNFDYRIAGETSEVRKRKNTERGKMSGALIGLVTNEHYLRAKQLTPTLVTHFLTVVAEEKPDRIIMSYLYTGELLPLLPPGVEVIIDTHNNDWEWFGNLRDSTSNPVKRHLCDLSLQRTSGYVDALSGAVKLMHVSQADFDAYAEARPDMTHLLVPNGCDPKPRQSQPPYPTEPAELLFVGSLSSQMNQDALNHFASEFWPRLQGQARLTVLGSAPPSQVAELCNQFGWRLLPDADSATLDRAYEDAHYAILPFAYGAGSKLKLAEACGRAVPVLSTSAGTTGVTDLPESVFVSDAPDAWGAHLATFQMSRALRDESIAFAEKHSWAAVADELDTHLRPESTPRPEPLTA